MIDHSNRTDECPIRKAILRAGHLILYCAAAFGQSGAQPAFEVASIKPTPRERQYRLRTDYCHDGGRFSVGGTPVLWSLEYAFHLRDYQISGIPDWLNSFDSAYDMEGIPASPVGHEECRLMVQSLFLERFKLAVHRERKESPVYFLIAVKKGTKLREGGGVKLNGAVQFVSGRPQWPDGWTTPELANYLSEFAGRPVVDQTGLAGSYGIALDFSRADGDGRPSIFTAVQEQLGVKLEPGKAPVEKVVIDHIEKPSAN